MSLTQYAAPLLLMLIGFSLIFYGYQTPMAVVPPEFYSGVSIGGLARSADGDLIGSIPGFGNAISVFTSMEGQACQEYSFPVKVRYASIDGDPNLVISVIWNSNILVVCVRGFMVLPQVVYEQLTEYVKKGGFVVFIFYGESQLVNPPSNSEIKSTYIKYYVNQSTVITETSEKYKYFFFPYFLMGNFSYVYGKFIVTTSSGSLEDKPTIAGYKTGNGWVMVTSWVQPTSQNYFIGGLEVEIKYSAYESSKLLSFLFELYAKREQPLGTLTTTSITITTQTAGVTQTTVTTVTKVAERTETVSIPIAVSTSHLSSGSKLLFYAAGGGLIIAGFLLLTRRRED